jgi:hypothetical protein
VLELDFEDDEDLVEADVVVVELLNGVDVAVLVVKAGTVVLAAAEPLLAEAEAEPVTEPVGATVPTLEPLRVPVPPVAPNEEE